MEGRALGSVWGTGIVGLLLIHGAALAQAIEARPVMIGGAVDEDACGGAATVGGFAAASRGRLNVRAAPAVGAPVVDQLRLGARVVRCDASGPWVGIVYADDGGDCGTGTPVAGRRAYSGPCHSGWVHRRYLRDLAG